MPPLDDDSTAVTKKQELHNFIYFKYLGVSATSAAIDFCGCGEYITPECGSVLMCAPS
jgi:hypothetical protein